MLTGACWGSPVVDFGFVLNTYDGPGHVAWKDPKTRSPPDDSIHGFAGGIKLRRICE